MTLRCPPPLHPLIPGSGGARLKLAIVIDVAMDPKCAQIDDGSRFGGEEGSRGSGGGVPAIAAEVSAGKAG